VLLDRDPERGRITETVAAEVCAIVTWFVFLRIQTARAGAGEEIGRATAAVPAI
jgi:hypothetical protein